MIAPACPRCGSVSNIARATLPASGRDKGQVKCGWCGWLGHETELDHTIMAGPEPEPRTKREKARDDDPFLFDV